MNKSLAITLITIMAIVIVGLSLCLAFLIKKEFKFPKIDFSNNMSVTSVDNKEFDTIKDLNIKSNIADIFVKKSDNDKIKIELYSDYVKEAKIEDNDNNIEVILKEKIAFMSFFRKYGRIVVYVPESYYKTIKINSDTSDVTIDSFLEGNADIKLDTGDVKINDMNLVRIDTDTGDAIINNVIEADIETDTGDVNIKKVNQVTTNTDTGDVKINKINDYMNLRTDTGDILINTADLYANSKIKTNTGDITIKNINQIWIDADAKTGDVKINENSRKSDIELIINTDTGDIKVG